MTGTGTRERTSDTAVAEGEILLVDKPAGWTSFDVIKKLRRVYGGLKMGHAGTLDPLATGLLIVCTGRMRKSIEQFMALDKEYDATLRLGIRTPSYDMATEACEERSVEGITETRVAEVLASYVGPSLQIPPMWSAVKVGGTRLYKLARKGMEVERAPRPVEIHAIRPHRIAIPEVSFTVVCSKGTYVRTLVSDIGETLGCGAVLTSLRRTRIGPYRIADAMTIDHFVQQAEAVRPA
jgi:tRNA pseudouridine55 synthase